MVGGGILAPIQEYGVAGELLPSAGVGYFRSKGDLMQGTVVQQATVQRPMKKAMTSSSEPLERWLAGVKMSTLLAPLFA